ncbi:MAG: hypothetical protein KDB61_01875, partial [Planctomycetes bacterium]|nr:hypothetical protein [Planctomycetota bacterium]
MTMIPLRLFPWILGLLAFSSVQCAQSSTAPAVPAEACAGDRPGAPCFVTRIMCVGDSNTQGGADLPSYRYPLWFDLQAAGSLVDFVGTQFVTVGENGTTQPNLTQFPEYYTSFDRDHEGYSGYRTDELLPLLAPAVAMDCPDVCVLLMGTNDIGQRGAIGAQEALIGLEELVKEVRSQAPATMFLIGTLPPIGPGSFYFANEAFVPQFNGD